MDKDMILIESIAGLVDGIENKSLAISALLKMAIAVGCKERQSQKENCAYCLLSSSICREIYQRSNILLEIEKQS